METCELPLCLNSALCDWLFTCNNATLVNGQSLFLIFYLVNRWLTPSLPPPPSSTLKKKKPDVFCGQSFIVWWKRWHCGEASCPYHHFWTLILFMTFRHWGRLILTPQSELAKFDQGHCSLCACLVSFLSLVPCGLSRFLTDCLPTQVLLQSFLLHADHLSTYSCPSVCLVPCRLSLFLVECLCSLQTVSQLMPFFGLFLFLADHLATHVLLRSFLLHADRLLNSRPSVHLIPCRPSLYSCPLLFLAPCTLFLADRLAACVRLQSFLLTASCRVAEITLVQMTLINFQT